MTARFGKKAKRLNRSNSPRTWLWSYVIRHIATSLTFNRFKPHLKITCTLYIKVTVICYMAHDQGLGLSPGPVSPSPSRPKPYPYANSNTMYTTYISRNTWWHTGWQLLAKLFPYPEVTGSTPANDKVLTKQQVTHGAHGLGYASTYH
jgi:hypothetical protein